MSDPKRLLDDAAAAPHLAALLGALPKAQPPSAQKEAELVRRLLTPFAPVPVAAGLALKGWLGVGALVLAGGLGGAWLLSRPAAPVLPPRVTNIAPLPVLPAPVLAPSAAPPNVETPFKAAVSPAPSAVKAVARDTLAEEEALLEQARRSLASSPGAALALLRQHQQRFSAGQLTAERLFLSVEALQRVGDRAGAERQAQTLLRRFPGSVYAGQLRGQAGERARTASVDENPEVSRILGRGLDVAELFEGFPVRPQMRGGERDVREPRHVLGLLVRVLGACERPRWLHRRNWRKQTEPYRHGHADANAGRHATRHDSTAHDRWQSR